MDQKKSEEIDPRRSEGNVKNIVREILRECTNKGIKLHENFVNYFVKLLILDPNWDITPDELAERGIVQNFVKHCLQILFVPSMPCVLILKMQLYFNNIFNVKKERSEAHVDLLREKLKPLEKEIINFKVNDYSMQVDDTDFNRLLKKMVYFVTLLGGLGNPTNEEVYEEAEAAFKSVFHMTDFNIFIAETEDYRVYCLTDLTDLTTGVRLFNKDCQKGGESIEDLPKLLNYALQALKQDIDEILQYIMETVNFLTTAVDNCYKIVEQEGEVKTVLILPADVDPEEIESAKDFLVFYRQYELYVRRISDEVDKIDQQLSVLMEIYSNILKKIHSVTELRTIVLTTLVYPHFIDLAQTWYKIQGLAIFVGDLTRILYELALFEQTCDYSEEKMYRLIGTQIPQTDSERLIAIQTMLQIETPDVLFLSPEEIENFDSIPLEYLGFCAWRLVETDGGLIPGNVNLGVAKFNERYYLFSSQQAAEEFCKDPKDNVNRALQLARTKPELINFLQLREMLEEVADVRTLVKEKVVLKAQREVSMETELHLPPQCGGKYFWKHNYMWNVWDWKRQAIILANISTMKTHSTQTIKSKAFSSIRVQTHEQRDKCLQTKKDNYTNVPKPSTFIFGLRGRKDDIQHIIDLTRPVDE